MLKTKSAIGILALIAVIYAPQTLAELKSYQATYNVMKSGLTLGTMTAQLSITGNRYHFSRETQASGLASVISGDHLTEQAQGTIKSNQLQPTSYLYHHKNRKKERRDQFQFISPTQVKGSKNNEPYQLTIPAGTIDPLTMELELINDLSTNHTLKYNVTEKGELRNYTFQKLGQEKVSVPSGEYDCLKLQVARDDNERQTTLWVAPSLGYATIKIRHTEDGDSIETHLSRFNTR